MLVNNINYYCYEINNQTSIIKARGNAYACINTWKLSPKWCCHDLNLLLIWVLVNNINNLQAWKLISMNKLEKKLKLGENVSWNEMGLNENVEIFIIKTKRTKKKSFFKAKVLMPKLMFYLTRNQQSSTVTIPFVTLQGWSQTTSIIILILPINLILTRTPKSQKHKSWS